MLYNDQLDDTPILDACGSFEGGVFSDALPKRLSANQAALMQNVDIEANGDATTRRGVERVGTGYVEEAGTYAGGRWIQGLCGYNVGLGHRLLAVNNRSLWQNVGGSTWARVTGYGAGALLSHTQIPVTMLQADNKLYLTDVYSSISAYDGTTVTSLGSGSSTQPPFGCVSLAWHTNRLVAAGAAIYRDVVAFSDILDATRWDTTTQQLVIGSGDGEEVTGVFSWVDFNLIVFKRRSIWMVNCNPAVSVAEFSVKPINRSLGVIAHRTAAQVGQAADVFVLTTDGVRSISRTIAVENQQDVGRSISTPVDDVLRRITPGSLSACHAISRGHRYILFVALDGSTYPNYALVYNTLLQAWSGYWTGWDATCAATRIVGQATERLVIGDAHGRVKEWRDYETTETAASYTDDTAAIETKIDTRALIFNDAQAPKTGLQYEIEYAAKNFGTLAAPTIRSVDQAGVLDTSHTLGTLDGATTQESFDLQARGQFRELQFRINSPAAKLSVKRVLANAWTDTLVLQT